jgi:serine/threonine protein kinase
MQIPEEPRSSGSNISNQARQPRGGDEGGPPDPPTVIRSSTGSSQRQKAAALTVPSALPPPGEVIDTFRLEEAIGVGGMGAVFRAHDAQLDREVALKLLPPDQTGDPEVVQRFYQEGRAAARLDHENIARVYSIGQDGPHHFIVFEFIEGLTVRRRVDEQGPLPVSEAVDITLQIAQALVHAADRGVVHRDIKPSNIILTPLGRAKLVDMGLARRFERETDHGLTQSGMTLGTFDYISPEQARDPRDVDVRSDLYSLGCTLFHMLTGRPPFPGGTVLQKLLQHQEEPPPDVQSLNPKVPADLARLINKLMAKDRDRRYQSPEQLVRDLLALAGQVGLAVIQPDQHDWTIGRRGLTWEHHQAWLFPALAFLLVVAGLLWWGRGPTGPESSEPGLASLRSPRNEMAPGTRAVPPAAGNAASPRPTGLDIEGASPPRNITARPGDDLLDLISKAPAKAVITLSEDGTYLVGARTEPFRGPRTLVNRDVTIKAEPGSRPVLRFAADARERERQAAILPFVGGTVILEGLCFDLEGSEGQSAAVSADDTDLTIRRSVFRQGPLLAASNRTALRVRVRKTTGDRPPAVFADSCHFDGGQAALLVEGPADLLLRDCTFGPASAAIRLANGPAVNPVPVEVVLRHTSLMAGAGPVFVIEGSLAKIQLDDCVVAAAEPSRSPPPALVAIDNPRALSWRGRGNLYSGIRAYLQSTRDGESFQEITDFASWQETPTEVRERNSAAASEPVWDASTPQRKLANRQDDPIGAFELATAYRQGSAFTGARQGPYGVRLAGPAALAQGPPAVPSPYASRTGDPIREAPPAARSMPGPPAAGKPDDPPPPAAAPTSPALADRDSPEAVDDEQTLPAMPPMVTPPSGEPVAAATPDDARFESSASNPAPRERGGADRQGEALSDPRPTAGTGGGEDVIRSAEQFASAMNRLGARGGVLKIARGADLELPSTEFAGTGIWKIEAEPGTSRPRVRFLPPAFSNRPAGAWAVLFQLRSGSLRLRGLDIVIRNQGQEGSRSGRMAAVGVAPGTELVVSNCTLTAAAGQAASSAPIVAQSVATDPGTTEARAASQAATVEIDDTFLRSAGDCFYVAPGRLLSLRLQNVLAGSEGSLLHALGSSTQPDRSRIALTLRIVRTLALTRGGLVHLESTASETELPLTEVVAENSIFSTAGQALLRVDGQGQMEALRDRIVWKAQRVAYDQISTYRRDQILQTGKLPRDYTRSDWRISFEPTDVSPVLDDVRFLTRLDPGKSAEQLSRDDMRLDPRSPAIDRGPDLVKIPDPPTVGL